MNSGGNMKRLLVVAAMMMVGSASVQAQDFKLYAGVGIGGFGIETKNATVSLAQKNTVLGGYGKFGVDINDYVGVELRAGSIGTGEKNQPASVFGTATKFSQTTDYFLSYLAKLQYPLAQDFRVYAMAGATTAKVKSTTAPNVPAANISATKTGFSYGFGGEYFLTDQFSIGAEWVQYWTDVTITTNTKTNIWGAVGTISYHF
jgi:opacity protein-like surface antigen